MWIDTNDGNGINTGLINLDKAERIAIVDEINIHIFRLGGELLAALQYPSVDEAEAAYEDIQVKVGIKAEAKSNSTIANDVIKNHLNRR